MPRFIDTYTEDLRADDLQRLFTRDTRDAYRFFARGVDLASLDHLPWHRRFIARARLLFLAFTLKLSPPRRAIYGIAIVVTLIGLLQLFSGVRVAGWPLGPPVPTPVFRNGTGWLLIGFFLMNLLVLLEVADRLSLKNDLDIAREIQEAMLPRGVFAAPGVEAFGLTRPANTVGGDFYDIQPLPDGKVAVALGDVAGKGSPAALLMALLLAMLRTLLDERLPVPALLERLNVQICRHAPASRFITLFFGVFDPATGELEYVNAGQNPPLVRRRQGSVERLETGGIALGMFERSRYTPGRVTFGPSDLLVTYSDGITEAEDPQLRPFEEIGLQHTVELHASQSLQQIGDSVFRAVAAHAQETRFADDLTLLLLRRPFPPDEPNHPAGV